MSGNRVPKSRGHFCCCPSALPGFSPSLSTPTKPPQERSDGDAVTAPSLLLKSPLWKWPCGQTSSKAIKGGKGLVLIPPRPPRCPSERGGGLATSSHCVDLQPSHSPRQSLRIIYEVSGYSDHKVGTERLLHFSCHKRETVSFCLFLALSVFTMNRGSARPEVICLSTKTKLLRRARLGPWLPPPPSPDGQGTCLSYCTKMGQGPFHQAVATGQRMN